MEPDQQPVTEPSDQEKLPKSDEQSKDNAGIEVTPTKVEESTQPEPEMPEAPKPVEASPETTEKSPETSPPKANTLQLEKEAESTENAEKVDEKQSNVVDDTKKSSEEEKSTVENKPKEDSAKAEPQVVNTPPEDTGEKSNLTSFPGTVKSVPGSNDVKIEIDSNSLLDRVILYSLKNTVVDNSRLDAAKNKYMLNKGNITASFSSNSNGSDSNSSSKSVEKLIEEFNGGCTKNSSPAEATSAEQKSDISNESSSNGAETCVKSSDKEVEEVHNVITSSRGAERKSIESMPQKDVHVEAAKPEESPKLPESTSPKNLENETLDFRDTSKEASPAMLDLTIPHRDEKSVPMIKRNHALYVGLPDFSKQIFTEPSISRPTNTVTNQMVNPGSTTGPPKIKNPDFSVPRGQPELQMRKPDFSKSFESAQSTTTVPVTPTNFPEIIRKNNYISDLQLKPPSNNQPSNPSTSSSSYKIDYRTSAAISQKLLQESKPEQPSTSQTVYPNMKKESINAYNQQQLIIDEPMAHIIHKNQFMPHANEAPRVGWNDRGERLLGGSSLSVQRPRNHSESEVKPQISEQYQNSNEDLRKSHPAHYPHREYNNNSKEAHQLSSHEFSLKQKEQQLRQEGTIITVKNEPMKTPTREITERRSADLFRDYKLKQPKESPDSVRRAAEHHPPMTYQQSYPDFPVTYPKHGQPPKVENAVKTNHNSIPPLAYPQMKQMPSSSRTYHSPSPIQYQHHQPKSPLTVPPGPSLMNPPSNWPPPPPLVMQQPVARHAASPGGHSQSPNGYPPHHQSPSQSPHMNYGYPYPPQGPTAVKVNPNYPPYKAADPYGSRHPEVKEIPNRNYQPPSSSSSAPNNYYHQKYPDFGRHFDQDKPQQGPYDPNARHPQGYPQSDPRIDGSYQRKPHNELEIRAVREQPQYRMEPGPSFYQKPHEKEQMPMQNYPPRVQEPVMRHPEPPIRIHDDERSRVPVPMKVERRIDEPPKIQAGPSNLNLRRPEPTEVSVIAKVKIEPAQPPRNVPSTSTIIKSATSIFAEVKRESPLDLSVKTVKTKADSTGCDQDMMSRHRAEPSGLKVEFTPNFGKIAKTDCRSQARMGPQDYPQGSSRSSQNVPERPQRYPEEAARTPPTQSHQQMHANARSGYYPDQRYQPVKEMERDRPRAPAAPFPTSSQYPERMNYPVEQNPIEHPRPTAPPNQREIPRPEDARRANPYYLPPQQPAVAAAPYPVPPKPVLHSAADTSRPMNSRDPLYYERERDRKNVENILYGRHRRENLPGQPDMRHFQPISSPPRKRVIENHQSAVPPKQVRVEEPPRSMVPMHIPPNHYQQLEQQRYQKIENHAKSLQAMGQPPMLVKNEAYPRPIPSHDPNHYPDSRKDMPVAPNHPHYPNSQYYPNPKAEMIHRSDPSYKQERVQYPNQNFQQRPDDNTPQYQRIHHPIQQESGIKSEQQAGPLPGTSGEPARMINGMIPASVSGSNGNIARGADQSTIMKLKNNLEQKKLSKSEHGDDDMQKQHDLSPRQFRSKGAMKAFVPLPTTFEAKHVSTTSPALPSTGQSAFDLLDWGSACNDFVQQLETGKKRPKKKRSMNSKGMDEKSTSGIPGTTSNNLSEIPKDIIMNSKKHSSSDEDKPLLELVNSDTKVHNTVVEKISEKISRNMREKQRLELEQKIAARLGKPSSSESETDTRRPQRPTKRVRRLRKRAALGIKKTDEEPSVEEEETEDEVTCKRRSSKSVSKLDDLTSSEDETKKNLKDKKSGDDKKVTKTAKKAAGKDAKKPETSSESSESDEATEEKVSKLSTSKNAKKLKDLGNGSSIKNLLEEEETMTRSKRKLEIEKKLSNSKILRNEKVVQNISPDKKAKIDTTPTSSKKTTPKRKDSAKSEDAKRKTVESDSDNGGKNKKKLRRVSSKVESSSEESQAEEDNKAERLRPRKNKPENETPTKAPRKKSDEKQTTTKPVEENSPEGEPKQTLPCRIPFSGMFPFKDEKTSKFAPGWEAETYSFKRSLKVPAGLITIGRPPQHGISHSLPDLDPQTSDTSEIFSEFVKSKDKEGVKDIKGKAESSKAQKSKDNVPKKPNSIIDVLHQRVIQSKKKFKAKKAANVAGGTPVQANDDDLLPTPEKESEKIFGIKKNIFETSIITSRTRTENNALRKKEILKEVFGADERPKSAPPVGAPKPDEAETEAVPEDPQEPEAKISYDQKYREYLEKMNVDFLTTKSTDTSKTEECKTADTSVKDDDEDDDDNETVVASERDLVTPTLKGKVKKGRVRRCKGSSGFDYIRKKKKPAPNASENPLSVNNIIKKRLAAMENLETKSENDISKEIKGWVLNKGVGESVLHKASRLDYVDVIAYCLERLNMSPDQKDNAGYTPLHVACFCGHLEIARILLQYGANHSETALSGIRPLHEAIENGHVEIVRLLISYGADPCLATYSGQLPIAMAEDEDMEDFLREYLKDIDDKTEKRTYWYFDGPFKIEDPSDEGYEVFNDIPIVKTDLGSSVASVFSTSLTSLVTATTQMSDNETNASESTATPIKVPSQPMKAPSQDLIKYQHKMKKCDTNSNNLVMNSLEVSSQDNNKLKKTKGCSVVLNNIDSTMKKIKKLPAIPKQEQPKLPEPIQKLEEIKHKEDYDDMVDGDNLESDNEFLELEESEAPLPPLYLLKDEGSDKWILLTDLCNLLKVKSKDAVLKQICPSSPPSVNKELIRELKMSDFLEKAICLQLFCAGEKLNVRASKVSLVRYNDSVRNLLGVQTIRMNM